MNLVMEIDKPESAKQERRRSLPEAIDDIAALAEESRRLVDLGETAESIKMLASVPRYTSATPSLEAGSLPSVSTNSKPG